MDIKTIEHISSLARIKLQKKEEETLKNELSSIIDFVEQLNKVETDNVEPLYQASGLVNSFRSDEPRKELEMSEILDKKLIGQAPLKEKRFIKVRSVLNKDILS